jgi:hypothetical protein
MQMPPCTDDFVDAEKGPGGVIAAAQRIGSPMKQAISPGVCIGSRS